VLRSDENEERTTHDVVKSLSLVSVPLDRVRDLLRGGSVEVDCLTFHRPNSSVNKAV